MKEGQRAAVGRTPVDRESLEAIQCALEHGIQTFDTAYIFTAEAMRRSFWERP